MAGERELILKARAGDKDAFSELVKTYQERIFFTALRLMRNTEDAKEVTQDAFICAYRAIKGFRLRATFYTWIWRIALNLCYRRLKSATYRNRFRTFSMDAPIQTEGGNYLKDFASQSPGPYQEVLSRENVALIQKALVSLKPKFYQALVLFVLEGFSYQEIARIQHCSIGTVMSRLSRGRAQLEKILEKYGINLA
ncbi:MAG: RNA polymerase subunit sigma-24 [Candidatus Omnitrophica bacterium CG11_big_fil_rev_8_21_14_0_20_42_13]|uniref:RNA polymerase subunit sigma-24 n=1 Tax=Candidatus Ghiorseimicrobium undicola TaxID=1974746 RepID=A0A2H0LZ84_9BACT|nr:MAG: RNA polymerase subunit sigma-24 [Candidatus Omnitrophica bacterium CG11_big_fil_rev_8_21_14_0_20_42_13]